uniref:DUF6431 domain-containing protein n=1 Tax=Candidatus Kentrum sp. FM TaxID=2126340 RepID=A0A450VYK3_9GAMM|nr:MAG: hypothetical protein BECKFM1743A_GA0114220_102682 [Candidatus Kentron sp. FM]VFK09859.1 MAG: hypothetical protein BECKFM1743B_GA0114221_101187 [Candidatus Kentron sp. FM]
MCRMIGSVRTLTQHFLTLNIAPSDYKPKRCPRCGVAGLWAHGVYHRKGDRSIISDNRSVSTPIPRFRCPHCNTTCSRLPGCLSPRRWYPWDTGYGVVPGFQGQHACPRARVGCCLRGYHQALAGLVGRTHRDVRISPARCFCLPGPARPGKGVLVWRTQGKAVVADDGGAVPPGGSCPMSF